MTVVPDRQQCGRSPPDTPALQILCDYLVLFESGEMSWLPYQHAVLESGRARELVVVFECRYGRDSQRLCNHVAC